MARPLWRDKEGNLDRTVLLLTVVVVLAGVLALWRGGAWDFVLFGGVVLLYAVRWLGASPGQQRRIAALWLLFWLSIMVLRYQRFPVTVVAFACVVVFFVLAIIAERKLARESWQVPPVRKPV